MKALEIGSGIWFAVRIIFMAIANPFLILLAIYLFCIWVMDLKRGSSDHAND